MVGRKALVRALVGVSALTLIAVGVVTTLVIQAASKGDGDMVDPPMLAEEASSGEGGVLVSTSGIDGAPILELSIPEGWEVMSRTDGSSRPPHPLGSGAETIVVGHPDVQVFLHYWPCPSSLYADRGRLPKAMVAKAAGAAFDPATGAASGQTDAGPFMVAQAEYCTDPTERDDHMTTRLVLLPESFAGEHPVTMMQTTCFLGFQYAGYAIWITSDDVGDLSEEERLQAVEVLSSLHVAG